MEGHETSHTAEFPKRINSYFDSKVHTTLDNSNNEWQLPELISPNKSVFVKDYMKKVKYKKVKQKKLKHERHLTTQPIRDVLTRPTDSSQPNVQKDIRAKIMHFQWSNDFPAKPFIHKEHIRKDQSKEEYAQEETIRYPDLQLFLSMLHNNRFPDPSKVKKIYGSSVKPPFKAVVSQ